MIHSYLVCGTSEPTKNFVRGSSYFILSDILYKIGSVTNEDTSPGPVKTYLLGFGGAPGRI